MRVLLAGATGTIGHPLIRLLHRSGHQVVGLTRDPRRARSLAQAGVEPLVADALDRDGLLAATRGRTVDAVVHEMTALRRPPARHGAMRRTNLLRTTGTRNLLEVAHETGAARFVTQSIVFGYGYTDHGDDPRTESAPFGRLTSGRANPHVEAMAVNEDLVRTDPDVAGVALRYGVFYGSATDAIAPMLRARKIPVPAGPGHPLPWIHVEDAAAATVAALELGARGAAYNIVDDEAASWRQVFTAMAENLGAPRPRTLPGWLIRIAAPYLACMAIDTSMRVANTAARRELDWTPRYPGYREGARALRDRT